MEGVTITVLVACARHHVASIVKIYQVGNILVDIGGELVIFAVFQVAVLVGDQVAVFSKQLKTVGAREAGLNDVQQIINPQTIIDVRLFYCNRLGLVT